MMSEKSKGSGFNSFLVSSDQNATSFSQNKLLEIYVSSATKHAIDCGLKF